MQHGDHTSETTLSEIAQLNFSGSSKHRIKYDCEEEEQNYAYDNVDSEYDLPTHDTDHKSQNIN